MFARRSLAATLLVLFALQAFSSVASAQAVNRIAITKVVNAAAISLTDASGATVAATENLEISQGYSIATGAGASLTLVFSNGSVVRVDPNTSVSVAEFSQQPHSEQDLGALRREPSVSRTTLKLDRGDIYGTTKSLRARSRFNIETPVGIAGIRGTDWFAQVVQTVAGAFEAILGVTDGSIEFSPTDGSALVTIPGGKQIKVNVEVDAQGQVQLRVEPQADVPATTAARVQAVVDTANADLTTEFQAQGTTPTTRRTVDATDVIEAVEEQLEEPTERAGTDRNLSTTTPGG